MKKKFLITTLLLTGSFSFAQTLSPDVAPAQTGKHIVINLPQQRMFVYQEGTLKNIYPVAIGKSKTSTPPGEYKIGPVALNPTWHIPKSIQKERAASGKTAITTIPPGPNNPLGPVFIRFGDPKLSLGIHGTNVPSSVPGVRSHGCVRMKSPDALKMAKFVDRGMPVSIIYQQASLNEDGKGQLWLAAYGNPYNQKALDREKLNKTLKLWETKKGVTLNHARIDQTLKNKKAQAVCISCEKLTGNKIIGTLTPLAWTEGKLTLGSKAPEGGQAKPTAQPQPQPANPTPKSDSKPASGVSPSETFPWDEGDIMGIKAD